MKTDVCVACLSLQHQYWECRKHRCGHNGDRSSSCDSNTCHCENWDRSSNLMELSADFVAVWAVVAVGKLHAVFQALKCVAVTVWTNLGLTCQYCSPTCTCIWQPTCCRYLLYFLKKHFLVCETVTVYWPRGLGLNGMLLGQCPWNHIRLTLPLLQLWGILSSRTSYFFLVLMCEPDLHLSSDEKKLRRFTQGTGILVCGICSCFQWWQAVIMVTVPCPFLSVLVLVLVWLIAALLFVCLLSDYE